MADLDTLTNKELHQKLLQYNLTNVPVTDSNRKILIRRITAAMEGKDPSNKSTKPTAKRRETVHATTARTNENARVKKPVVPALSSGDEDERVTTSSNTAASRRRTVNVTTKAPKAARKPDERHIPVHVEPRFTSTLLSDLSPITAVSSPDTDRNRRSISLSKTGVLTTSYTRESAPASQTYEVVSEEMEEDDEGDDMDEVEMMDDYEPEDDRVDDAEGRGAENLRYSNFQSANYNNVYASPLLATSNTSPNRLYPDLHSAGLTNPTNFGSTGLGGQASFSSSASGNTAERAGLFKKPAQLPMRQTLGGVSSYSYGLGAGEKSTLPSYSSSRFSTFNRMNSSNSSATSGGSISKRSIARAVDVDSDIGSSSDDQLNTPYFSKFTRNLDDIKSQPLLSSSSHYTTQAAPPPYLGRYSRGPPPAPRSRRGTDRVDGSMALVAKYHLKEALIMALVFVAAVFIYVFFVQGE